jgi:hypothetical protein
MIARIWTTGLDESRAEEYQRFADTRSRPMFRRHEGFLGVLFCSAPGRRTVITLWTDERAAATLGDSPDYQDTVAALTALAVLRPPQQVEVLQVDGGEGLPGA